MSLGINVLYFRKLRGLTNKELADAINFSQGWVSKLENDKHQEEIETVYIEKIASVLKVRKEQLTGDDKELKEKFARVQSDILNLRPNRHTMKEIDDLIQYTQNSFGPSEQAFAYLLRGHIDSIQQLKMKAIEFYEKSLAISLTWKDKRMIHRARHNLSNMKMELGEYSEARKKVQENLMMDLQPIERARDLQLFATICFQQENWECAKSAVTQALTLIPRSGEYMKLRADNLQVLGAVYFYTEKYTKAIEVSTESVELSEKINDKKCQHYAKRIIGDALFALGKIADANETYTHSLSLTENDSVESLELDFRIAQCEQDNSAGYIRMKNSIRKLEEKLIAPRSMAKYYEEMAKAAYELSLIDDVNLYYTKAMNCLRAIIK